MSCESFEITEMNLRLDAALLPALLAVAREHGYLEKHDRDSTDDGDGAELEALEALLSELFPDNFELSADLEISEPDFAWWSGQRFPVDDVSEIFAAAALPGCSITFLDFTEGDRDIYDIVFDGAGDFERRDLIRNGVPVRDRGCRPDHCSAAHDDCPQSGAQELHRTGLVGRCLQDAETFRFGRYDYTREDLVREARSADKPAHVVRFLETVALEDLLAEADEEAAFNPTDDSVGWDETSQLMAAATFLAG